MDNQFTNQTLDVVGLPDLGQVEYTGISPRYAYVLLASNVVWFAFYAIGIVVLAFTVDFWVYIAVGGLIVFIVSLLLVRTIVKSKGYALREHDISYKSGIIYRNWTTLPFNRIQHCEISRGMFDNLFDTSELKVYTAGGSSSDLSIPGLEPTTATKLKSFILSTIDEEE